MDALEEMCDHLPSDYSDQCKAIVEMYGPQLIKLVEAQLAPQAICGALGLCAGYQKTIPARCQEPKSVGMCRALIKCEFFGIKNFQTTAITLKTFQLKLYSSRLLQRR